MGREFKHEGMNCQMTLPEPLTGAHYQAWTKAFWELDKVDFNLRGILGFLSIVESGFYVEGGIERSIKDRGLDTLLPVLLWAGAEASTYVNEIMNIPKASTQPAAPPPIERTEETTETKRK